MTIRYRLAALCTALVLGWSLAGFAQGAKKDGDLDDLLKKVDEASKPTAADPAKPEKPGGVAPKDKDLDDFLEKLGDARDKPSENGKPPEQPPGGGPSDDMKKPDQKGGQGDKDRSKDKEQNGGDKSKQSKPKKDDGLKGEDKDLDEHLSGADRKKQRGGQGQGQGQGRKKGEEDGPMGDLVKQMREVEKRLGQPDTGEETRQKQTQIVKRLDGLIEQMRLVRSQRQMRQMMQGQQQPGQQPGQQATNNPQEGVGLQKPAAPRPKSVVALDKNAWGHLPPGLREEMDNVSKEAPLPQRDDLIKRYYISVAKKSLSRQE